MNRGEIFGYLGPNGAGKTTTMRLLLGLLAPDAGDSLVFSSNLREQDLIRRNVGVLFENNGLFERFSAYDNLESSQLSIGSVMRKRELRISSILSA